LFVIDRSATYHRLLQIDLETGAEREILRDDRLHTVAAAADGNRVAVVYRDGNVEVLEPPTKRRIAVAQLRLAPHWVKFLPDGRTLATAMELDRPPYLVEIRDSNTLALKKSLEFSFVPLHMTCDWTGDRFIIETVGNRYHVFAKDGSSLSLCRRIGCGPVTFSPDGEDLALGHGDGRVQTGKDVLEPQESSLPGPLPRSEAWCVAFAPDGKALAAGYDNRNGPLTQTLRLWDLSAPRAKALPGHEGTVMALAISPDGKSMATASFDRTVRIWNMAPGQCLHELRGHTDAVRALAFSADGRRIASAGSDLSIRFWNVDDGSPVRVWVGHGDAIRSLTFSPNGDFLISAANDRTIKIWNAQDGSLLRSIFDEDKVQSVACSPDGLLLASGNEKNTVELWQLATGSLWKSLPGHTGKVRSVTFSADGKTLASGGEDKTVRLWNVATGQEMLVLPTEHYVNGLAFNPQKPVLAAALHDGTVKIWSGE
jgi:WD40 repeat protein